MYHFLESLLKSLIHADSQQFIKWTDVEKLHITLQFIKNIQRADVDPLIKQVNARLKNNTAFQLQFDNSPYAPTFARH